MIEVQRFKTALPPEASLDKPIEARFVAVVKRIEVLGTQKVTVTPVGPDPRWLVTIEIVSLAKPAQPFTRKGRIILAVHSPAKLFSVDGHEAVGEVYTFTLSGTIREGHPSYHSVETSATPPSARK